MIDFICSGCSKAYAVSDDKAGKRTKCPCCGESLTVPMSLPSNQAGSPSTGTKTHTYSLAPIEETSTGTKEATSFGLASRKCPKCGHRSHKSGNPSGKPAPIEPDVERVINRAVVVFRSIEILPLSKLSKTIKKVFHRLVRDQPTPDQLVAIIDGVVERRFEAYLDRVATESAQRIERWLVEYLGRLKEFGVAKNQPVERIRLVVEAEASEFRSTLLGENSEEEYIETSKTERLPSPYECDHCGRAKAIRRCLACGLRLCFAHKECPECGAGEQ